MKEARATAEAQLKSQIDSLAGKPIDQINPTADAIAGREGNERPYPLVPLAFFGSLPETKV